MNDDWHAVEGIGWIDIPDFGRINPRQDNVGGGRQYFNATTDGGEQAKATGMGITGGPELWYFEFDDPFWLADRDDRGLELSISLLPGARYAVKYRQSDWPGQRPTGGWSMDD